MLHSGWRSCALGVSIVLGLMSWTEAHADTVIFERALPNSTNVNNAAGASESNTSWINQSAGGFTFLNGDDINLAQSPISNPSGSWLINSISVFEVANTPISSGTSMMPPAGSAPQVEFQKLTLFEGSDPNGTLSPISSQYTSAFVQYEPLGLNYQGSSGTYYPIYEITFSNLGLLVPANADLGFAVNAVPNGNNTWAIHASNAALSGTPQNGADGLYRIYQGNSPTPAGVTSATYCCSEDSAPNPPDPNGDNSFTSSTDINVIVTGSVAGAAVPEPSSTLLAALGLFGLGLLSRRRK